MRNRIFDVNLCYKALIILGNNSKLARDLDIYRCVQRAIVYTRSLTLTRLRGRRATKVIIRATTLEQESRGAYYSVIIIFRNTILIINILHSARLINFYD